MSSQRLSRRQRKARAGSSSALGNKAQSGPPSLRTNIRIRHTFRFVSATGSSTGVTLLGSDLCTILNSKVAGSTTTALIIASARLRKASLWFQYSTQGTGGSAPSQIAVQPGLMIPPTNNSVMDNPVESKSDIVLGTAEPGHVVLVMPRGAAASNWHTSTSTEPVLVVNTGGTQYSCVLDLDVEIALTDDKYAASTFVGTSGSSTSLGSLSFTGFAPVGYQPQ